MAGTHQDSEHTGAVHTVALANMRRKGRGGYRWWLLGALVLAGAAVALWWFWH